MSRRGQLVLLTAAVVAAALAPALLAYLQLGYHADRDAAADFEDPAANAVRVLDRAAFEARLDGDYAWANRTRAADRVRATLRPRIDRLAGSRVADGTATLVSYNATAARAWVESSCPGGDGRVFGPCRADGGVVVQERAGEAALVAVAFDVRVVTERGETRLTVVATPS
ncbi:DUF7261 family protein [Halosegnis marinus]|uniref:Uncharacterized protein n=1 Tax=Halosegnis marinus TaxID=3034023 RepID=A0ABD5ZMU5_9EURY|nr:hypothetical protein [Halosegnis sp. DT85]